MSLAEERRFSEPPLADILAPLPNALLDDPLEHILADHSRQRSATAALRRFSETGSASRADAAALGRFLTLDMQVHHQDEDEALFPALSRRALPEDNLPDCLARLAEEHRRADDSRAVILAALSRDGDPIAFAQPVRAAMLRHARAEQRHLAIENSVVLPLARVRLTRGDLRTISASMKRCRGI